SVPARSLMVATSLVARIERSEIRVGLSRMSLSVSLGRPNGSGLRPARWQAPAGPGGSIRAARVMGPRMAVLFAAVVSLVAAAATQAGAAEATKIRVNTFPNAKALPVHVGIAKGLFAKYGLAVELENTESSQSQRDGLAAGRFQIAHAALDNAVAMIEVAKRDVVIVSGGDSGMNEFFVQPGISSFADLRGKTIVVDAPDTAYALQARKLLLQHGLREGADYTVKQVGAV